LFFLGALAFTKKVAPMAAMARKTTAVRNEKVMIIYSYQNIFFVIKYLSVIAAFGLCVKKDSYLVGKIHTMHESHSLKSPG
jgi:hypothetical protein